MFVVCTFERCVQTVPLFLNTTQRERAYGLLCALCLQFQFSTSLSNNRSAAGVKPPADENGKILAFTHAFREPRPSNSRDLEGARKLEFMAASFAERGFNDDMVTHLDLVFRSSFGRSRAATHHKLD